MKYIYFLIYSKAVIYSLVTISIFVSFISYSQSKVLSVLLITSAIFIFFLSMSVQKILIFFISMFKSHYINEIDNCKSKLYFFKQESKKLSNQLKEEQSKNNSYLKYKSELKNKSIENTELIKKNEQLKLKIIGYENRDFKAIKKILAKKEFSKKIERYKNIVKQKEKEIGTLESKLNKSENKIQEQDKLIGIKDTVIHNLKEQIKLTESSYITNDSQHKDLLDIDSDFCDFKGITFGLVGGGYKITSSQLKKIINNIGGTFIGHHNGIDDNNDRLTSIAYADVIIILASHITHTSTDILQKEIDKLNNSFKDYTLEHSKKKDTEVHTKYYKKLRYLRVKPYTVYGGLDSLKRYLASLSCIELTKMKNSREKLTLLQN